MCEQQGKITLANVVDHIFPHRGDVIKFFRGPFQSLCYAHHNSTKQKIEKREIEIGGDESGNPIDQTAAWQAMTL